MDVSPEWIMTSLVVSSLGFGLFLYGKKQTRPPQLLAGLLLMGGSAVIASPLWMLGATGLVLALLWGALRFGA